MDKKIIFFVTNLDSGGLENYLLRFLKVYSSKFNEAIVVCRSGRGGVLENEYTALPNVTVLKKKVGNFHINHYIDLFFWLQKKKSYIVCDFTGNFAAPILELSKWVGIKKRIVFYRSSSNRFVETRLRLMINKLYNNLIKKSATHILANSDYAFKFFFNCSDDPRFNLVYNGIDIESFLKDKQNLRREFHISESDIVIGHTGRYNPSKNHAVILEVAKKMVEKFKNLKFFLCGKGVKENLESKIIELGIEHNMILSENRPDIPQVLNTFDVFIFPSLTEGQPNSLIEAWIKGLPFVASNITPIRDIVPEELQEYLVDPVDVDGMVNILSNHVMNPQKYNSDFTSSWSQSAFDSNSRFLDFFKIIDK